MRLGLLHTAASAGLLLLSSSVAVNAQSMSSSAAPGSSTSMASASSSDAGSSSSSSMMMASSSSSASTSSTTASSTSSASASFASPSTVLAPSDVTGPVPENFMPPTLRQDNGTNGVGIEIVHYYYGYWPIGLAVVSGKTGDGSNSTTSNSSSSSNSSSGSTNTSIFACYVRGNYSYTMSKLTNITTEEAWPSQEAQLAPDQLQNMSLSSTTGYTFASDDSTHLINVQALYVDPKGRLWALDTGRPTIRLPTGAYSTAYAVVGGPKLVRFNADNSTIAQTITFPGNVHYPDSYMNDLRFDLRSNITESGQGVAYIVDSSNEGRNAFIVVDLGTGHSWRRLEQHPSTLHIYNNRPTYFGEPFYTVTPGQAEQSNKEGFDGLALSNDGEYAYYSPLTSNYLYRVPTSFLRVDNGPNGTNGHEAELFASQAVTNMGQKGSQTNGFDSDTNGMIYMLAPEQNAIFMFDPSTGKVSTLVRDPRLLWIDSAVVADDGYIYGNINQLPLQAEWNNGTELREHPGMMFRAQLPNGGKRITTTLGG